MARRLQNAPRMDTGTRRIIVTLALGSGLTLAGCSLTPPICHPQNAYQAGYNQGSRGEPMNAHVGSSCKPESGFEQNFRAGYQKGNAAYCEPSRVEKLGREKGQSGSRAPFPARDFTVCEPEAELQAAWERGVAGGLEVFCSGDEVVARARAAGAEGRSRPAANGSFEACGVERARAIAERARAAYDEALAGFCRADPAELERRGYQRAARGGGREDLRATFRRCDPGQVDRHVAAYRGGYDRGLRAYCATDRVRDVAAEAASAREPGAPASLRVCFDEMPRLRRTYRKVWREERARYVAEHCTYARGVESGREAAASTNQRDPAMPDFCDTRRYRSFSTGYREGFRQGKKDLCDRLEAFQQGLADGRRGRRNSYQPPALCPSPYAEKLARQYLAGYREGRASQGSSGHSVASGGGHHHSHSRQDRLDEAYDACIREGYSPSSCEGVTAASCIREGYSPSSCDGRVRDYRAFDACIDEGYTPSSCWQTISSVCLREGYTPSSCDGRPRNLEAFEACVQEGYTPSSCWKVRRASCVRAGHSPSSCSR